MLRTINSIPKLRIIVEALLGSIPLLGATLMLAFCFYGIQETGSKLENPFGWDDIDHNLERYGMSMCLETELIAETAGTGLHGTHEDVSYLTPKLSAAHAVRGR